MPTEVIRRISIQATQQGVAEATTGLKNLSAAQDGIVSSSEKMTKSQLSVASAYERQQRSLDIAYRSTQQFEKAQRTLDQALQQGIVTVQRHAELSALNADKHNVLTKAANDNTTATSLNQAQLLELGHAAKATFEQIAAGTPILRVLAQQGTTTAQALSLGQGGIAGSLKSVAGTIAGVMGPLGLVALGFAAVEAAAIAWFVLMEKKGKTSEEILTEHNRLLNIVKNSYDNVADAASKWYDQSKAVTQLQLLQQQVDLSQKLVEATTKAIRPAVSQSIITGEVDVLPKFKPFRDAIADLNEQWQNGKPDVRAYLDEVARIGLANPALRAVAAELIKNAGDAQKFETALRQVGEAMKLIEGKKLTADDRGSLGLPDVAKPQADPFTAQVNSISKHIAAVQADAAAVGASVGEHARLRAEFQLMEVATRDGKTATDAQKKSIEELSKAAGEAAQSLAQKAAQSQADFDRQTVFLPEIEKHIAAIQRQLHGDDWKSWMNDGLAAQIRMTDQLKQINDLARQVSSTFANDLVQGLISGKGAMESLTSAANSLGKSLTTAGINNIIKDPTNPVGYIEAGVGIVTQLVTGNDEAKKKLAEAQEAWKKMTREVTAFNLAVAGVDLGPLTNELNSLFSNFTTLIDAAVKAQDKSGQAKLENSFQAGVQRIVNEFFGASQTLSPLQKSMKDINDEATGLIATLNDLGYTFQANQIAQELPHRIAVLLSNYRDALTAGLTERLNVANNKAYLNDAARIIKQHQADLSDAALLGNNPILLEQISATFKAEAQNVVNNAGLIGDAFTDFQKQFPQLAGVVTEATADIAASQKELQDQLNASAKTITDYVNGLFAGNGSTLSPTAQLAAAQSAYNTKLGLAQSGNASAQSTITQDAENLRLAARAVFASGSGYQAIFSQITSQLLALPAVQATTDPVTQAVRDAITAINAANSVGILGTISTHTSNLPGIATSTGGTMSGITGPLATNTFNAATNANNTRASVDNNTSATNTGNATLAAIQSINTTLTNALAPNAFNSTINVTSPTTGNVTTAALNNTTLLALNKIVFNTAATANNTALWTGGGSTQSNFESRVKGYTFAAGGWIPGNLHANGGTMINAERGEFVVNRAAASALAPFMSTINRGILPVANDNGGVVAELRSLRAAVTMLMQQNNQLTWEAGEKGAQATRESIRALRDETRMRKRDQRAA